MSGFLALLDDVAAIAKLAASQLDDIAAQSAKAGAKAAGVVIDDAAVTPKYVVGLPAARELPIVWKIARASLFNKLVVLTPVALLLAAFAPWLLAPLLMLGGLYLCFEGAEKVHHLLVPHEPPEGSPQKAEVLDAAHLEQTRVAGAVKTDFILSAEIMAITLSTIDSDSLVTQVLTLVVVAVVITVAVYGAVALLVKADDVGLRLSAAGNSAAVRSLGRGIVAAMPGVMAFISTVGTAAMLWVGGNIVIHGFHELGWHWPYETVKHVAGAASAAVPGGGGFVGWLVTALIDGVVGLVLGFLLIPVVTRVLNPLIERVLGRRDRAAAH